MIKDNFSKIKEQIASVCRRINQDPRQISLVAVSKGRTLEEIQEVAAAGITDIGENRIQEAIIKYENLQLIAYNLQLIKWHMVGHLQTNKVKEAVRIFSLIQSVDSLHLAEEIDRQAAKISKIQDILIEIKTSPEVTKFGLEPAKTVGEIRGMAQLKNINIKGLMTIAPIVEDPEKTRPYFRMLRELRDTINDVRATKYDVQTLSMGMSDDFQVAIEEGSNMIRLGRAIFGP